MEGGEVDGDVVVFLEVEVLIWPYLDPVLLVDDWGEGGLMINVC